MPMYIHVRASCAIGSGHEISSARKLIWPNSTEYTGVGRNHSMVNPRLSIIRENAEGSNIFGKKKHGES